jgi:hypothetical protein
MATASARRSINFSSFLSIYDRSSGAAGMVNIPSDEGSFGEGFGIGSRERQRRKSRARRRRLRSKAGVGPATTRLVSYRHRLIVQMMLLNLALESLILRLRSDPHVCSSPLLSDCRLRRLYLFVLLIEGPVMPRPGFSQPSDIIAAYTVAVYPFHLPPYGQIAQLTDEGAGFCQMRALRVL